MFMVKVLTTKYMILIKRVSGGALKNRDLILIAEIILLYKRKSSSAFP
jgi:hypothetical protein